MLSVLVPSESPSRNEDGNALSCCSRKPKRKLGLILILVLAIATLGCVGLGVKVRVKCKEIEGRVWKYFGGKGLRIVVIVNGTAPYIPVIKMLSGGVPVKVYRWSNLTDEERAAVERVLKAYGIPFEFPIVMAVGPPIVYITTGCPVLPPMLKTLMDQHPYYFFQKPGRKYVLMLGYGMNPGMFSKELYELMKKGPVAIYYPDPHLGFANSIVINRTLKLPLNSVIVLKGDRVVKVIPLRVKVKLILFFYSPYCPHCERVLPLVRRISGRFRVRMFDVTRDPTIASRYGIYEVPTMIVVTNRGNVTLVGDKAIEEWIFSGI